MFIFHKLKMIYILVPKTGTNSFWKSMTKVHKEERLEPKKNHPVFKMEPITHVAHLTARQVRTLVDKEIWESYEKVGFVRHPYDWIISYFNTKGIKSILGEDTSAPFSEFIRKIKMTPFYWFTDTNGELLIDTIYRTEDLKEILEGYGCKLLHDNKSAKTDLTVESLSDDDKQVINKKFKREMEYYTSTSSTA